MFLRQRFVFWSPSSSCNAAIQSNRKREYGWWGESFAKRTHEVCRLVNLCFSRMRLHQQINDIHGSSPGTIGSRAYWFPDTINLGEML
jgi:hypothetical protein